jgi:hypothetical protein
MRILRGLALGLGALALIFAAVWGMARFLDGPLGPFPGGPLRGVVSAEDPGDWSFAETESTLELEVGGRSLTVWFTAPGGVLYVAAAEAARKSWPAEVAADGRVRIRVAGRLYERRAVRIEDEQLGRAVAESFSSKYEVELDDAARSRAWLFRLDPR